MGRPAVDSEQLNLRVMRPELDALDAFDASKDDRPRRTEAVRRILSDWLLANGFLRFDE